MQKFAFYFLIVGFVSGQVASLKLVHGIRVTLLDIAVAIFLLFSFKEIINNSIRFYLKFFSPFFIVSLISLILQINILGIGVVISSSLYLVRFIIYSILIVAVYQKSKLYSQNLLYLFIAGIIVAIFGLLQYALYPNLRNLSYLGWDPHQYRIFSTFLDPNFLGIIIVLTLFCGIKLLTQFPNYKNFLIFLLVTCVAALLLTYSRGSYVALFVGTAVYLLIHKKLKYLLFLFITFILILTFLPKPEGSGVDLFRIFSIQSRIEDSKEAFDVFLNSPIFGVGFNTLRFYKNVAVDEFGNLSHAGSGFHNSYLTLLAMTGIAGLITYFRIWYSIFVAIRKSISSQQIIFKKHWLLTVSVVAIFVHGFFDNSLFYPSVMFWMWVLAGGELRTTASKSL